MTKRVLVAGLFHETHTFLEERTALDAFQIRTGDQLLETKGDGSPMAGVVEVAALCGWTLIPTVDMRATPSGSVADAVLEEFWKQFETRASAALADNSVDGICLVLHGAMVCDSLADVEGEVVRRVRNLAGDEIPICGVLDLHGNISQYHIESTQGFSVYRCNPHTDAHEAAVRGARLLDKILTTKTKPTCVWSQPDVMWPPTGTGTDDVAMKTLQEMARQVEDEVDGIEFVNVFGGFSFADTPNTGVSINAVTFGDPQVARESIEELSSWATENRDQGNIVDLNLDDMADQIRQCVQSAAKGPVAIVDPSDNIGGGAPGDTTDLLKFLLAEQFPNSAIVINDPDVVSQLSNSTIGETVQVVLGAKSSAAFCDPVDLSAKLVSRSDGKFDLEDRNSHLASMCGIHVDMGNCIVLKSGEVSILVTSRKTPPFDLGQFRSQGIEPESCSLIVVKAAVAHRRAYNPITSASFTVNTSGPCSSNIKSFDFKQVRRPIFPLD
jgi:microcystin degradation protein MlrC